jgi:hypothetical protein
MAVMRTWEYATLGLASVNGRTNLIWDGPDGIRDITTRNPGPHDFVEQLNQAGRAGWEAVGYASTMDSSRIATGSVETGIHGRPGIVAVTRSCLLRRPLE